MKSSDDIKKGLEHCRLGKPCVDCSYDRRDFPHCVARLMEGAAYIVNQLEQRLTQVERERDAAVRDCARFPCSTCDDKQNGDLCHDCNVRKNTTRTNYEWRGVCPENTKEEST